MNFSFIDEILLKSAVRDLREHARARGNSSYQIQRNFPIVKNMLSFIAGKVQNDNVHNDLLEQVSAVEKRINLANAVLASNVAKMIPNKGTVAVESLTPHVIRSLLSASKNKSFTVSYTTALPKAHQNILKRYFSTKEYASISKNKMFEKADIVLNGPENKKSYVLATSWEANKLFEGKIISEHGIQSAEQLMNSAKSSFFLR